LGKHWEKVGWQPPGALTGWHHFGKSLMAQVGPTLLESDRLGHDDPMASKKLPLKTNLPRDI
jgi:hypothetical protein